MWEKVNVLALGLASFLPVWGAIVSLGTNDFSLLGDGSLCVCVCECVHALSQQGTIKEIQDAYFLILWTPAPSVQPGGAPNLTETTQGPLSWADLQFPSHLSYKFICNLSSVHSPFYFFFCFTAIHPYCQFLNDDNAQNLF